MTSKSDGYNEALDDVIAMLDKVLTNPATYEESPYALGNEKDNKLIQLGVQQGLIGAWLRVVYMKKQREKEKEKETEIITGVIINRELVRALQTQKLVGKYDGHYEINFPNYECILCIVI